jgi:hypothetical protein
MAGEPRWWATCWRARCGRVQGQPEAVYHAGQSFYEPPNAVHAVSANTSGERPARFLAYFTCDRQTELSVPVADRTASHSEGRKP